MPAQLPTEEEFCELLCSGKEVRIERIISHGHHTPLGEWLDQDLNEWVVLLEGRASLLFDNGEKLDLEREDAVFLPAHRKHRVEETSSAPPCVWLAVHGRMSAL